MKHLRTKCTGSGVEHPSSRLMLSHAARTCPHCSTVIPSGFPPDLCPRCLLAAQMPGSPISPPASSAADPDSLHLLFPDLEILDVLGSGGMGTVYKARQPRLDRIVALKVMTCESSHEKDFALRFEREAQVLARLNHPNIVSIFDFGEIPSSHTGSSPLFYFLMEHVEGTDLTRLIHSRELTPSQALAIVPQICDALQFAHEEGITHRDIKPANILIDKKGKVKIADFGLAKMAGPGQEISGLTQTGTTIGTPHYMAPEQWDDPESVDHRTDIYALGVVFYEMLTGERPMGRFDPPSRKSPIDRRIDEVVLRAMEREPDRRYQQASEIKTAVSNLAARHSGPSGKKIDGFKLTAAIATLVLLLGSGIYLWKNRAPATTTILPTSTDHFPSGKWTPIDSLMRSTPGIITDSGGWWRQEDGYHLKLGTFSARNAGIRCRVQRGSEKLPQPILRDHKHTPGNQGRTTGFAIMHVRNPGLTSQFSRLDEAVGMIDLGQFPTPSSVVENKEYLLEFYAIGKTLIARIDGSTFTATIDKEPPSLGTGAAFFNLAWNHVCDMELINLDGLDEAEALRLAGADPSTPLSPQ